MHANVDRDDSDQAGFCGRPCRRYLSQSFSPSLETPRLLASPMGSSNFLEATIGM